MTFVMGVLQNITFCAPWSAAQDKQFTFSTANKPVIKEKPGIFFGELA
jgi:hypothetical protein